jgi:hypothetical protein
MLISSKYTLAFPEDEASVAAPWCGHALRPHRITPYSCATLVPRQARVRHAAVALLEEYPDAQEVPAEDKYLLARLPDFGDFAVEAYLVNVVYLSRLRCVTPERNAIHARALAPALLGIACFGVKSTRSTEIAFRYLPPFRGKHALTPNDMRMQETAATSGDIGSRVVDVTLNLLSEAAQCEQLFAFDRRDNNEVYTACLPFYIDLNLLHRRFPKSIEVPLRFDALIIQPPELGNKKLLVFPKGIIICVGSKNADEMMAAMRAWLPAIEACRVDPMALSPPPPLRGKKRPRASSAAGPPTKRPRKNMTPG